MQLRDGDAGRQVDDAVLDIAVLRHQHGERLARFQLDELDMLERHLVLGGEHQAGAARHAGQHLAGFGEHVFERGARAGGLDLCLDGAAFLVRQVAEFHEGVDEEAQAGLGRQPPGRDVRRVDEAEMFEVAHHVADGGRRQRQGQDARQ